MRKIVEKVNKKNSLIKCEIQILDGAPQKLQFLKNQTWYDIGIVLFFLQLKREQN